MSLLSYFTYACYARKLWQAALYSGAGATVLHFVLGLVISQKLGHSGLALATTLAKSAGAAGLFWLLARHAQRSQFSQLAGSIVRSLSAATLSCVAVYLILSVKPGQTIAAGGRRDSRIFFRGNDDAQPGGGGGLRSGGEGMEARKTRLKKNFA